MKCLKIDSNNLKKIFFKIEALLKKQNEALKFKIMLIAEEIITNQVKHSDFENRDMDIKFCIDFQPNEIILIFKDNAKKFDPLSQKEPDRTKSLENTTPGGLGIFLVKQYSKKIEFEYKNGFNILKVAL